MTILQQHPNLILSQLEYAPLNVITLGLTMLSLCRLKQPSVFVTFYGCQITFFETETLTQTIVRFKPQSQVMFDLTVKWLTFFFSLMFLALRLDSAWCRSRG